MYDLASDKIYEYTYLYPDRGTGPPAEGPGLGGSRSTAAVLGLGAVRGAWGGHGIGKRGDGG